MECGVVDQEFGCPVLSPSIVRYGSDEFIDDRIPGTVIDVE
jgi:hypothetical protein